MAVPAVGIGVTTRYTSATAAVTWFTAALLVMLAIVGMLSAHSAAAPRRGARHEG